MFREREVAEKFRRRFSLTPGSGHDCELTRAFSEGRIRWTARASA
jgi:hypothetical protein